jgi:hypothetical protein
VQKHAPVGGGRLVRPAPPGVTARRVGPAVGVRAAAGGGVAAVVAVAVAVDRHGDRQLSVPQGVLQLCLAAAPLHGAAGAEAAGQPRARARATAELGPRERRGAGAGGAEPERECGGLAAGGEQPQATRRGAGGERAGRRAEARGA